MYVFQVSLIKVYLCFKTVCGESFHLQFFFLCVYFRDDSGSYAKSSGANRISGIATELRG